MSQSDSGNASAVCCCLTERRQDTAQLLGACGNQQQRERWRQYEKYSVTVDSGASANVCGRDDFAHVATVPSNKA